MRWGLLYGIHLLFIINIIQSWGACSLLCTHASTPAAPLSFLWCLPLLFCVPRNGCPSILNIITPVSIFLVADNVEVYDSVLVQRQFKRTDSNPSPTTSMSHPVVPSSRKSTRRSSQWRNGLTIFRCCVPYRLHPGRVQLASSLNVSRVPMTKHPDTPCQPAKPILCYEWRDLDNMK